MRDATLWAVPADEMGTASLEAVKVLPFPAVQKTPWRIGKWFLDRRVAAPMKEKVKKPAGKRDPLGCGKTAWA